MNEKVITAKSQQDLACQPYVHFMTYFYQAYSFKEFCFLSVSITVPLATNIIAVVIEDNPSQLLTTAFLSCAYLKKTNASLISSNTNSKLSFVSYQSLTVMHLSEFLFFDLFHHDLLLFSLNCSCPAVFNLTDIR